MPVNLKSVVEAVNASKLESLKPLMSPELSSRVAEGLKGVGTAAKNIQYEVNQSKAEGNHVAFTYTAKGTSNAGKPATWTGSAIATMDGDKIVDLHVHEDYIARFLATEGVSLATLVGPSATGTWVGTASGLTVTLHLVQSGGKITGNVAISGFSGTFPVTGQNNYPSTPNLDVNATVVGLATEFSGNFNGNNQAAGTLTISGFTPLDVVINRST